MKNILLISLFLNTILLADDSKKMAYAADLMLHGLTEKATESYISILHQSEDENVKAQCLLQLGKIAVKDGKMQVAAIDWGRLLNEYPDSKEANEVKDQLSNIIQSSQEDSLGEIKSAVALNYLNNASFYIDRSERWLLDTSYLPAEEFGAYWCDRVIKEFPGTKAHEMALKKMFIAYLGWNKGGSNYGLKFKSSYINQLEDIINEMEMKFPNSGNLPAMFFQMGQYYWRSALLSFSPNPSDLENAKLWFDKIITTTNEGEYYHELVKLRYKNWNKRGTPVE